ncbi:PKD repeat protein [Pedobacter sp. UYEF25]
MTPKFGKFFRIVFLSTILLFLSIKVFSQLSIATVDAGPYTPGSGIAATFTLGSGTCMQQGNVFNSYLVSSNGTETLIGTFNGFYATFVNGQIPITTLPGSYKIRIKSTIPVLISNDSQPFTVQLGTPVLAEINSSPQMATNLRDGKPEVFGVCSANNNDRTFNITNNSTTGSTVSASIKNEVNSGISNLAFSQNQNVSFIAKPAHYTAFIKATVNGTVSTRAYFFLNNNDAIAFETSGKSVVCLPTKLTYGINTTGFAKNFPGNIYTVNWGDGSSDSYTICDIINNQNTVDHLYLKSSCGSTFGNVSNAFGITISASNQFCASIGTALSTTAKVVLRPVNSFTFQTPGCTNTNIVFKNTSFAGQNPNSNGPECTPNDVLYTWLVDGVVVERDKQINYNFVHKFDRGSHTITLMSSNPGACDADPFIATACIQDPAKPAFTLPTTTLCTPSTLIPIDKSIIDNVCSGANTYNWVVTPAVATIGGTNLQSKQPEFSFTKPGVYKILLQITTPSCGLVSSASQTVVVNTTPKATLSPEVTLCNPTTYDFNNVTTGPTYTLLTGSPNPQADTYTWTVTGTGVYSFEKGDAHSQYPSIKFDDYTEYTVTVVQQNGCGTASATQKLTFKPAPKVDAGPDQSICFKESSFTLNAAISDNSVGHSWVGGNGVFFPNRDALNATYTPTLQERTSGIVTVTLRATTALAAPCKTIDDEIILTIKPKLDLTSEATLNICTTEVLKYQPTNNVAGSIFTWTATGSANATGYSTSGTGLITDQLTNTDLTKNAQVVYTIVPQYDGCNGASFSLVVNISPLPVVTATAIAATICSGTNTNITLASNLPNTTYAYSSTINGTVTGNSSRAVANTDAFINDKLINTGSTNATVTYTIIPAVSGKCSAAPITKIITVYPAVPVADAGKDMSLCSGNGIQLSGNDAGAGTGKWTLESGQPSVVIQNPSLFNTQVTGLIAGETYTFRWAIIGAAPCSASSDEVKITFYPPIVNTIGSKDVTICNGTNATFTGNVPTGGVGGQFTFSWEKSTDNGATWSVITGETNKDLSLNFTETISIRRLVNSNICTSFSNIVNLKVRLPLADNTISSDQVVCFDKSLSPLQGSAPTGGDGNYAYQWQKSTDFGLNWSDISGGNNRNLDLSGTVINGWFRRVVTSATCGSAQNISNVVKVTIIQPAKATFNFTSDKGCSPFELDAKSITAESYPSNETYTWYADNALIGTGLAFPVYTIIGGNKTVTIKLVTTSLNGCNVAIFEHTFSTYDILQGSFTQDLSDGCGPLSVTFKNTSSPLTDATFAWDFGNGQKSTAANPGTVVFEADPTGKDITYTVTLTASTPCNTIVKTSTVMVKAKAISVFSPDRTTACSPATINFTNTSPGNTNTYYFDFGDGTNSGPLTDKSLVSHVYTTSKIKEYVVTMRTENNCGGATSSYTITISPNTIVPELVINSNEKQGCAPLSVNLYNNTSGANVFTYTFVNNTTGEQSTTITTKSPEVLNHVFSTGGNYTVTLVATNGCSTATTSETIVVYDKPVLNFAADKTDGCDGLKVTFKNTVQSGIGYLWDFGDGQTSTDNAPTHIYTGVGKSFTVTLTATNQLGCTTSTTLPNYITLVPPPVADFEVNPGNSITIPNYTFSFLNRSTEGVIWEWDFGDGVTSRLQNPVHLYPDTGIYRVNLKVYNKGGCASTTYQTVRIIGVPGFLYLPNSFMPGSAKDEIRTFKAKGVGMKEYKLSIFNKWGMLVFETTELSDGAPSIGWDGTYKGVPQPQGVYFWKAEVKFTNGSAWKGMSYKGEPARKAGGIYLIR